MSLQYNDIKFVKIDISKNNEISDILNIQYIPLFIYFKNGIKIREYIGVSEIEILELIE